MGCPPPPKPWPRYFIKNCTRNNKTVCRGRCPLGRSATSPRPAGSHPQGKPIHKIKLFVKFLIASTTKPRNGHCARQPKRITILPKGMCRNPAHVFLFALYQTVYPAHQICSVALPAAGEQISAKTQHLARQRPNKVRVPPKLYPIKKQITHSQPQTRRGRGWQTADLVL